MLFFLKGDSLDATKNVPAVQTVQSTRAETKYSWEAAEDVAMSDWLTEKERVCKDNEPQGGRRAGRTRECM